MILKAIFLAAHRYFAQAVGATKLHEERSMGRVSEIVQGSQSDKSVQTMLKFQTNVNKDSKLMNELSLNKTAFTRGPDTSKQVDVQ